MFYIDVYLKITVLRLVLPESLSKMVSVTDDISRFIFVLFVTSTIDMTNSSSCSMRVSSTITAKTVEDNSPGLIETAEVKIW